MAMDKKVMLMILDGWGIATDTSVSAVDAANTPYIDALYTKYPNATLRTDGMNVGLPEGQMGNSEVGHLNIGAGRIVYQDLAKINIDENQQLATQLRIQSIPAVIAFHKKKIVNGFQGALPKNKIIEFIEKILGKKVIKFL